MDKQLKWGEMIESLINMFGEKHTDFVVKHFKCEEKLTKGADKDLIQITIVIEIERDKP